MDHCSTTDPGTDKGFGKDESSAETRAADIVLSRLLGAACWISCFSEENKTFLVPFGLANRQLRVLSSVAAYPFNDRPLDDKAFGQVSNEVWNAIMKRTLRARSVMALSSDPLDFEHGSVPWSKLLRRVPGIQPIVGDITGNIRFTVVGSAGVLAKMPDEQYAGALLAGMIAGQMASLPPEDLERAASGRYFGGRLQPSAMDLRPVKMLLPVTGQAYDAWNFYDGLLFWIGEHLTEHDVFSTSGSPLQQWMESSRHWANKKSAGADTVRFNIDRARVSHDWIDVPRFFKAG